MVDFGPGNFRFKTRRCLFKCAKEGLMLKMLLQNDENSQISISMRPTT